MLQRIIGEDIRLNTHLDSSGGRVLSDPDQIQQVVMNLAVNARDAMPDGGKFRIATSCIDIEEGGTTALGPDAFAGNFIRLTIGDTGHGMDHATCQRIFEPFFTTKELGKGTGLGLSTVYGIVKQSGGWITVSSEPGVGTTFEIYLPRTDLPAATHITVRHNRIPDGRETILLVEDQDAVRAFTREALTRFGYTVLEAAAGEEALSLALGHNEPIHLLVTDVVLPGMNGKTLSEQLRRQRPDLKVLFVSGYSPDVISQRGVLEHGTEFLHKPFNPDALAEKVRKILGVRPAAPARILIAEDYQEVRRILAQHLRNSAYEVVEVSDGVAALEALQQRSADAAILDANMPRLGGLATAREIRRLYPETRIVLMSGAFDETSGTGAAGLGVDALFAKSGSPGGLLETLRRLGIGPPHTQVPDS
jgi:DNA-binding response OmpR family regulator